MISMIKNTGNIFYLLEDDISKQTTILSITPTNIIKQNQQIYSGKNRVNLL
jgi:hypothetical protein